jgi:PIN domain nuclease of toxin-antitoxin system
MAANGIHPLPIQVSHALHVHGLPDHHRDPFDRMLVAQSQLEDLPIVTPDQQIGQYGVQTVW